MNRFDLIIKNGLIVNPEENNLHLGNIGINGGKIAALTSEQILGVQEIDANGHVVCPGFIDVHAHLDGSFEGARASVTQGITTSIGGNCGLSPLHIADFLKAQSDKGFPINQAELIGQSFTVRDFVGAKNIYGPATKYQISEMGEIIERALVDGAIGVSFGLEYAPGYTWNEISAIARVAAKYHKVVPIHTNLVGPDDLEHLSEVIRLGEETGAHIHVSHFVYQYGMGAMTKALALLDEAIAKGIDISADSGMYTSFATMIGSRVYDEEHLLKFGWKYEDLLVSTGVYAGERLNRQLYKEMRERNPNESCICFTGIEEEIYEAFEKPYMMMSTDSGEHPTSHPQALGSYPRYFRKVVRERKELSLIEAVRRCTLLPARTFNLPEKGSLSQGFDADIVIFDPDTITDKAQFYGIGDPCAKSEGIDYVLVNGQAVVADGTLQKNAMPGKIIKY